MKAMEAPEKIYLTQLMLFATPTIRSSGNEVEYIRTDVFIKKVSGWLKDCATFTDMNGKKRIDKEMYKTTFEDFKKYIKGE